MVNRLNAGCVSVLIEKGITRHLDRVDESDGPVRVVFFGYPALEEVVAVSHRILTMSRGRIVGEMESHKGSMQEIILSATGIVLIRADSFGRFQSGFVSSCVRNPNFGHRLRTHKLHRKDRKTGVK